MIKGTHFCHLRNPYGWKNAIDAFIVKQFVTRDKLPRDLGSPGNRQLLQLQPFSPNFLKFWAPPHDLALLVIIGSLNRLVGFCFRMILQIDFQTVPEVAYI